MNDVVRVAAFDVDGTITTRDCVVPFMRRVAGTVGLATRCARSPIALARSVGRGDRDAVKAIGARAAFAGRSVAEIEPIAADFASDVFNRHLRTETVEALQQHRADGDIVVLVSASFELYLRPLAVLLGTDHVLAARLASADGVYNGELLGPNCRGPEKVVRLHHWLDECYHGRSGAHVTAYGDSAGDSELLTDADVAHWVGTYRPADWSRG